MLQLIKQFQVQGFKIVFATTANHSDNAVDLSSINVKSESITLNDASFDEFIAELNPDVVLFDRFMTEEQFGWRVAEQCPNTIRILDTEDLHFLRKSREIALKANRKLTLQDLQSDAAKREIASIYRSDLSLVISEYEMELLKNEFQIEEQLLLYFPFITAEVNENHIQVMPSFTGRSNFVAIGNFLHKPNYDAVFYLKETIWPLIRRQLPEAELYIYGAYANHNVMKLNDQSEGFLVKGYAKEVGTVMQNAKVCLAPLRFGAGLKGKLIDAMTHGTPCIMSSIAAEGMFGEVEPNGFIVDDPEDFAKYAIELYRKQSLWEKFQSNGFRVLKNRFNDKVVSETLQVRVNDLISNIKRYRRDNFLGQLLMHHSMQSTKYMSKWIEEKNR